MARAPVTALPGPSRAINLPSLRAWASAAEGARLADWVRLEAPTIRVLTALLTENRGGGLSQANYTRLRDAIATEPEAFSRPVPRNCAPALRSQLNPKSGQSLLRPGTRLRSERGRNCCWSLL
jgi:hypothetical protein